jgi:hypothetical protein
MWLWLRRLRLWSYNKACKNFQTNIIVENIFLPILYDWISSNLNVKSKCRFRFFLMLSISAVAGAAGAASCYSSFPPAPPIWCGCLGLRLPTFLKWKNETTKCNAAWYTVQYGWNQCCRAAARATSFSCWSQSRFLSFALYKPMKMSRSQSLLSRSCMVFCLFIIGTASFCVHRVRAASIWCGSASLVAITPHLFEGLISTFCDI